MDKLTMVRAFNEWMRRYTEEPERFEREWQTVNEYLEDCRERVEPSYGRACARYMFEIAKEV